MHIARNGGRLQYLFSLEKISFKPHDNIMELRQLKYFIKTAETLSFGGIKSSMHNTEHFVATDKTA